MFSFTPRQAFFFLIIKYQCIGCPGAVPKQHAPYDTHHHSFIFCLLFFCHFVLKSFILRFSRPSRTILFIPLHFLLVFFIEFFFQFFLFVFFFPHPLSRPFSPRFPEAQGTVQNGMLWLDTHSSPPDEGRATRRLVMIRREQIHNCHDLLRGASSCAGPGDLTWRNTCKRRKSIQVTRDAHPV